MASVCLGASSANTSRQCLLHCPVNPLFHHHSIHLTRPIMVPLNNRLRLPDHLNHRQEKGKRPFKYRFLRKGRRQRHKDLLRQTLPRMVYKSGECVSYPPKSSGVEWENTLGQGQQRPEKSRFLMSLKKGLFACFSSEMLCLSELRNALHTFFFSQATSFSSSLSNPAVPLGTYLRPPVLRKAIPDIPRGLKHTVRAKPSQYVLGGGISMECIVIDRI